MASSRSILAGLGAWLLLGALRTGSFTPTKARQITDVETPGDADASPGTEPPETEGTVSESAAELRTHLAI